MTHIEELKAKVAELTATIEAMENEVAKPKKFEWKYPLYGNNRTIHTVGIDAINTCGKYKHYLEHGRYRLSKEVAEQSLLRNKRANRLEALAEQLDGLKEFVEFGANYYIYFNYYNRKYEADYFTTIYYPETVYMTKDCAIEICRMLNECEFSLEGEL